MSHFEYSRSSFVLLHQHCTEDLVCNVGDEVCNLDEVFARCTICHRGSSKACEFTSSSYGKKTLGPRTTYNIRMKDRHTEPRVSTMGKIERRPRPAQIENCTVESAAGPVLKTLHFTFSLQDPIYLSLLTLESLKNLI